MVATAPWREIIIPAHTGGDDLINRVLTAHAHVERWAENMLRLAKIVSRISPIKRPIIRIRNKDLGLTAPLVSISETKKIGLSQGLQFLSLEEILALRLSYMDQPPEWMRVAMQTQSDADESMLDLAIVNDGARIDIRTTWAFSQNVYQPQHEWFWSLPEQ